MRKKMQKQPKISVITPVYNVAGYLSECLDSIVNQDYDNLEIILIDDGSTDTSYDICKKYAKKDSRIHVYHQKNSGPGVARNTGLKHATGDWLSFVDADDVLDKDYFKNLTSHIADDINVVCANVKIIFDVDNKNKEKDKDFYSQELSGLKNVDYYLKKKINTELWNKIFRKEILDKYNIQFKSGAFEDGDVLFKVLSVSSKVYFDKTTNYFYRRRSNSIVENFLRGIFVKNCNILYGSVEELYSLYDFFVKNNLLSENIDFLIYLLERNYFWCVQQISVMQKSILDKLVSDFMHDCIPDEYINKYGTDVELLYRLKLVNVLTPFYCEDVKDKNLKIAVCYHKPSLLPDKENNIFFPIHLGRDLAMAASKDANIAQNDYQWLLDNMIGDNTGDNISEKNRKYCELTATYWAWKNYDKIGNPEYFGLCHYRRLFNLYNLNLDADVYIPETWVSDKNAYDQFVDYHKSDEMDIAMDVIKNNYPEFTETAEQYYKSHNLHLFNMFIMKKEIFFDYAKWLFDVLNKVEEKMNYDYRSYQALRGLAYLSERLQDLYCLKLKNDGYNVQELPLLIPDENKTLVVQTDIKPRKNACTVVTSCDDNYALYAGVMIKSVIENTKTDLDVYILDGGISKNHKEKIKLLQTENVNIKFVNMGVHVDKYMDLFKTNTHFTPATYYRFLLPLIFKDFDKVVYLDPDMIIRGDINELYNIDLKNAVIGAVRDAEAERKCTAESDLQKYFYNDLGIKNIHDYFQAGVMICDLKKMNEFDFTDKCLTKLREIGTPMWVDQDIMNSVCQGYVKFVEPEWNYCFFLELNDNYILNNLDYRIYDIMSKVKQNPKIIHYCGGPKPWNNPELPKAEIWWKYAKQTSFYEELLFKKQGSYIKPVVHMSGKQINRKKIKIKYTIHRFLSHIMFGKIAQRQKYSAACYKDLLNNM